MTTTASENRGGQGAYRKMIGIYTNINCIQVANFERAKVRE
jgi:hypothetical protein